MRRYTVQVKGKDYLVDVEELTPDTFRVVLDDTGLELRLQSHVDLAQAQITPAIVPVQATNGGSPAAHADGKAAGTTAPHTNGKVPAAVPARSAGQAAGGNTQTAPMPGVIVAVEVAPGDVVQRGQVLVVLEAMKMNNTLKAARDGVIAEVCVTPNQTVAHGDILVRFAEA